MVDLLSFEVLLSYFCLLQLHKCEGSVNIKEV